jgi:hypothetical protein
MTVKERNQLVNELEKAVSYHYPQPLDEKYCLQLLQALEKIDFKKSFVARIRMCWQLIYLLEHISFEQTEIGKEILERATKLLTKHAQRENKEHLIAVWSMYRNPVFESILYEQKWIKPAETIGPQVFEAEFSGNTHYSYIREDTGSLLLAFKFNDQEWLNKFFAHNNFEHLVLTVFRAATVERDEDIKTTALAFCHNLDESKKQLVHFQMERIIWMLEALEWLLTYKDYSPSVPRAKVTMALLTGKYSFRIRSETEAVVNALIEIVLYHVYPSRRLPEKAKQVLLHLKTPTGRNLLCLKVVELILSNGDYKELEAIAIQAGYEPIAPTDKALFFFLTGQFDKYDVLDFDRRLMRNIHETADNNLRRQIGQIVRSSGRTDYLEILNKGQQEVSNRLAYGEQKTTIQILRSNGRWDAIWQKIFELPFWGSVSALGVLQKADWQPDSNYERELFITLSNLLRAGLPSNRPFNILLPAGILRARVKVAGRVNGLVFAPDGRRLALATGNRKVIIWNLAQSAVEQTLSGFEASVGLVAYMPEGTLIWAERSNRADFAAGVWTWDGREKRRLGSVAGVATRLQPLNGGEFLVLNTTGQPQIWSIVTGRAVSVAQNFVIPATPDKTALDGNWRVSFAADRQLTFRSAAKERLTGTLKLPGEKLTVLEVSADGDLLAAVTEPTGFQLWDLRPLELLELLDQPFGAADTRYMAAVRLLKDTAHITQPVRNALTYIEAILRHRFRHAIEIEFAPHLQPGAADIELEILDE